MVSHQYRGLSLEQRTEQKNVLSALCGNMRSQGHEVFCSIEHEDDIRAQEATYGAQHTFEWCRSRQAMCDTVCFVITHEVESYGMQQELHYALTIARQRVALIAHEDHHARSWVFPFRVAPITEQFFVFRTASDCKQFVLR